ncbi:hypothetical protein CPB83DRAFT_840410 [Crepidotus variabilis]|uniref:Uncharacterized protein n=1 Tax=Crepidotus variabilis TaxID=179855 RepID=A0A9P6JIX7_9AGAR|nr:hypothetical protein CPB83DRAFT_840410 [Crepidotus variabilis]
MPPFTSPKDLERLDSVLLIALLIETLFVGNVICQIIPTQIFDKALLPALWFRAKTRRDNFFKPITFCALALFATITARWVMDTSRTFNAFILPERPYCVQAGQLTPAELAFSKLSDVNFVAGSAMYTLSAVLGDSFMIYRLWIIWGKNKLIIIPPIFFLGGIAITGTVVAWGFGKYDFAVLASNGPWIICSYLSTFLCNIYSTALIALKIFLSNRQLRKTHTRNGLDLAKVAEILVESAALYSCCMIISVATYLAASDVNDVMVTVNTPIIGIIFCMIVTQSHKASTKSSIISDLSYHRSGENVLPMQPFGVRIVTQSQIEDRDCGPAKLTPSEAKVLYSPT